jgi:hypothetical protein
MNSADLQEHSLVRLRQPLVLPHYRAIPPGVEGYVVDVRRGSRDQESTCTVEVIIHDERGVQVDGWLVEARHSDLELVTEHGAALVQITRIVQRWSCAVCTAPLEVVFERVSSMGIRLTTPVSCPKCETICADVALGALGPPHVAVIAQGAPE